MLAGALPATAAAPALSPARPVNPARVSRSRSTTHRSPTRCKSAAPSVLRPTWRPPVRPRDSPSRRPRRVTCWGSASTGDARPGNTCGGPAELVLVDLPQFVGRDAGGVLTTSWPSSNVGIDGGPLAVDTVLLFDLFRISCARHRMTRASPPPNSGRSTPRLAATCRPAQLPGVRRRRRARRGRLDRPATRGQRRCAARGGGTDYGLTDRRHLRARGRRRRRDRHCDRRRRDLPVRHRVHRRRGRFGEQCRQDRQDHSCAAGCRAWIPPFPGRAGGTRNLPEELRGDDPGRSVRPERLPAGACAGDAGPGPHVWRSAGPGRDLVADRAVQSPGPRCRRLRLLRLRDVDVDGTITGHSGVVGGGVPSSDPSVVAAAAWLSANQQASGGAAVQLRRREHQRHRPRRPDLPGAGQQLPPHPALPASSAAFRSPATSLVAGSLLTVGRCRRHRL